MSKYNWSKLGAEEFEELFQDAKAYRKSLKATQPAAPTGLEAVLASASPKVTKLPEAQPLTAKQSIIIEDAINTKAFSKAYSNLPLKGTLPISEGLFGKRSFARGNTNMLAIAIYADRTAKAYLGSVYQTGQRRIAQTANDNQAKAIEALYR